MVINKSYLVVSNVNVLNYNNFTKFDFCGV